MVPSSRGAGRRRARGRLIAASLVVLLLTLVVAVGGGCSAILGDATYECTPGGDGACPVDMICNADTRQCELSTSCSSTEPCPQGDSCNTAGRCVSDVPDATSDSTPGDDDDAARDAGDAGDARPGADTGAEAGPTDSGSDAPEGDTGPPPTTCVTSATCATGTFCATADQLGNGFVQQCTKTCCTSTDCASGYVCVPVGTSGQYCLPDANLGGNPPLTCCSSSASCGAKDCYFGSGGTAGTSAFGCSSAAGSGVQEDECVVDTDCRSGYCGNTYKPAATPPPAEQATACRERCCNSAQCGGADAGFDCHVESSLAAMGGASNTKDYVAVCYDKHETAAFLGLRNLGTACAADVECKTGLCDSNNLTGGVAACVDTCCVDSDCLSGQVCRPRTLDPPFLRCQTP